MPRRYLCDVLEEMRTCNKTRNYAVILSLIEEAQTLANRMEASLGDRKDFQFWHRKFKEEKSEYKKLLKETNKLRKKAGKEPKKMDHRW